MERFALSYQDDFFTPIIFPSRANSLKHILQIPNGLMYPFTFPHKSHLLYVRVGNLIFLPAATCLAAAVFLLLHLITNDVFAIEFLYAVFLNGNPIAFNNSKPFLSLPALVVMLISIPYGLVTSSGLISANTTCSLNPIL